MEAGKRPTLGPGRLFAPVWPSRRALKPVLRASPHSSQRSGCQEQARRTLAGAQALEHGLVAQCVLAGLHDQLQAGIDALTSLGLLRLWTPKQARVRERGP